MVFILELSTKNKSDLSGGALITPNYQVAPSLRQTMHYGRLACRWPVYTDRAYHVQLPGPWFPPGLETRENLEKWEGIFQSGKSQGFCQDWKSQGILLKILENWKKIIPEN